MRSGASSVLIARRVAGAGRHPPGRLARLHRERTPGSSPRSDSAEIRL
jgi:hypothetical protein